MENLGQLRSAEIQFLQELWFRLTGEAFDQAKFLTGVRHAGGHDFSNLSNQDLIDLFEGRFSGDWKEPAFSFSELLAFFSVKAPTPEQAVAWVFASFVVCDAIKNGKTDWELQFNLFMDGYFAHRSFFEPEEAVYVFQRVFTGNRS